MRTSDIKLRLPLHPFYEEIEDMTDSATALFTGTPFSQLDYAKRLATYLWEQHYKDEAPHWKPLDDMTGVLTQIDNMITDLPRRPQSRAAGQGSSGHRSGQEAAD